eukprot:CAMPEP_0168743658 /NCGR_PEP_ID=MMETSP0724-20121128/13691_1 /TAXON_ID=265536 /ORGANISM="Amphiprora sp., Strain CCMP467" /LENGTH=796 /DNA_ID=CAMNT_0008791297 /DNA_START=216 /DNA_END=2606 /DNA_ORIENTATION=+
MMINIQRQRRQTLTALSSLTLLFSYSACFSVIQLPVQVAQAWTLLPKSKNNAAVALTRKRTRLQAKRNKRAQSQKDEADLNRWYDDVDQNASPDDVFWEEMERQRLLAKVGESPSNSNGAGNNYNLPQQQGGYMDNSAANVYASSSPSPASMMSSTTSLGGSSSSPSLAKTNSLLKMAALNGQTQRSADATLSEYADFSCADNWLDEELVWMMNDDNLYDASMDDEHVKSLDEQLDEWEAMEDGANEEDEDDDDDETSNAWMHSDEPWDHWGEEQRQQEEEAAAAAASAGDATASGVHFNARADSFLFDSDSEEDEEELQRLEQETLDRLAKIQLRSPRLDRAAKSPNAKAFFDREPDTLEGYDRMWVSAIDNVCFKNLVGLFRNYGVQFADNFGDWQDGCLEDSSVATIEDIASYKAREVYNITGLPCIASRTSFEIEPIPTLNTGGSSNNNMGRAAMANSNPRVASGYKFNDVGMHVDYICDALRPLSEPTRVTRFKTCLCYYDGEMELFDYGICDVDLHFSNSLRTFIPMSQAINEMMQKLTLTFGLEYQSWLQARLAEGIAGATAAGSGPASLKLRDRVLKEGKVLPNDIIDVSAFMDSKVDVNLMDECAKELSNRFLKEKPNKILTVATTGLVIALPMAKYLQVPVVYARKERNVVMADTFKAGYSSKTVGKNRELLVSKSHVDEEDRVLIVDDFLSSGASQEALLRIVAESGATAVGVGVLLEKAYESGRQSLAGFDVPIQSLCRIASVKDGVIQLLEEVGFDRMQQKKKMKEQQQLQKQQQKQPAKEDA